MVTFQLGGETPPPPPLDSDPFHQWDHPDGSISTLFYRTRDGYLLRFPSLADFALDCGGERVRAWPAPGVEGPTLQHLYLNQVLPLAWSKLGKLVLHGSSVEVGGQAVAFIGSSGMGKSTLAASFAISGFRFLTDDGLVLDSEAGGFRAVPSHPSIRLWQDSQGALLGEAEQPAPPVQFTSKARFLAGNTIAFCDQSRPLSRVYFLGAGSEEAPVFTRMKPAEALLALVKNSFLLDTSERDMLTFHFDALSRLASLPIHFRLDYARDYQTLPQVRNAVVRHIAEQGVPT